MSLVVVSSSLPTRKYDSFLFLKELIMEESTSGSGDGLPMQRSRVENHLLVPWLTQPFIFLRWIK